MRQVSIRAFAVLLLFSAALVCKAAAPTPAEQHGKSLFQACRGCHNVLTDATKSAPSLRTLYGKVRLRNGKRTSDDNVTDLVMEGFNRMPSYRYMFRPEEWNDLLAYLKTLRGRPEFESTLEPTRGSDEEVLERATRTYNDRCASCHDAPNTKAPALLHAATRETTEESLLKRIRDNHGKTVGPDSPLTDAAIFELIALLKAP